MNTKITLISAALFLVSLALEGCATQATNPPNAPTNPVVNVTVTTAPKDNFDKAGEAIGGTTATVTRTTYNVVSDVASYVKDKAIETNDTYNTEENRQKVIDAAKAAKDKAVNVYNTVRE